MPPLLPHPQVHVFKLRKASNVNSLTNLVRVHSEWRATRPYMDAESIEAAMNKSKPPSMADGPFRVSTSWDKYREEDAPPPNVFSRDPASGRFTNGMSNAPASTNGDAPPPLPPRSSSLSGSRTSSGWTTFNNDVAEQAPPSSSTQNGGPWSTQQQPLALAADPFNTPLSVGPATNIPSTRVNASGPGSANGVSPLSRMSSGTIREQLARQYSQQYGDAAPGTPTGPGSVNQQQSPFSMQPPPASRAAPPPPMSAPGNLIDM